MTILAAAAAAAVAALRTVVATDPTPDEPSYDWDRRVNPRHSLHRLPPQADLDPDPPLLGAPATINPRITRDPAVLAVTPTEAPYRWPCPAGDHDALWFGTPTEGSGTRYTIACDTCGPVEEEITNR